MVEWWMRSEQSDLALRLETDRVQWYSCAPYYLNILLVYTYKVILVVLLSRIIVVLYTYYIFLISSTIILSPHHIHLFNTTITIQSHRLSLGVTSWTFSWPSLFVPYCSSGFPLSAWRYALRSNSLDFSSFSFLNLSSDSAASADDAFVDTDMISFGCEWEWWDDFLIICVDGDDDIDEK